MTNVNLLCALYRVEQVRTSSAMEMPSAPTPLRSLFGSFRAKASPMTPATGARVMYLLLNEATIPEKRKSVRYAIVFYTRLSSDMIGSWLGST